MKFFGILTVFTADFLYLYYLKQKKNKAVSHAKDYLMFLRFLNVNVLEKKMTLYNGVISLKGKISPYIDEFIRIFKENSNILNVRQSLINCADVYFSDINEKFKNLIKEYLYVLGNADKKTSMDFYGVTYDECLEIIEEEKSKTMKSIKITNIMTYGISAMAILILM